MSTLTAKIKEELYAMLPPTLFFFIALHLVAFIRILMLKGTGIPLSTSVSVTVAALVLASVDYTEGEAENYLLCVGYESGDKATRIETDSPLAVYVRLKVEKTGEEGYRALRFDEFTAANVELLMQLPSSFAQSSTVSA